MGQNLLDEKLSNIEVNTESIKESKYWHYERFRYLTNEQIVKLIQETNDPLCWDELDKRTQELYSSVMRDKVHNYYKENMKDDMLSVLKKGWVKAVKSYNEEKATAEFIPYCAFLMEQNYIMFARRINENKIGNSVRDEIMSCTTVDGYNNENTEKMSQGCVDIIMKSDCAEYEEIESTDYISDMLNRLKEHNEIQYFIIKKHCLEGVTQKDLGKMLNMSQSKISRYIKKGREFLKNEIELENMMY